MLISTVKSIKERYLEHSDSLDASSYEVSDLCEEIEKLQEILLQISELVQELPSGVDYQASAYDESPEDVSQHIGGLIWKLANRKIDF
jgi:predicted  nucleic acid-binding Zn-ribbon protein